MNETDREKLRRVPAEPQIGLGFEAPRAEAPGEAKCKGRTGMFFEDPDPRQQFISNQRLDRYLRAAGLGAVLSIGEFLHTLDWKPFEEAYKPGGRSPFHPRVMVGLVLLGITEGKSSLRELEELAASDVRAWWLTGGLLPDHSTIGKFIERHEKHLTGEFFEELTKQVLRVTGSDSRRIAGDGTVVEAVSSRLKLIKEEAAVQAAAEAREAAEAKPKDEGLKGKAELAAQVAQTARERSQERRAKGREKPEAPVSRYEPEAVTQPLKNKAVRPSYKPVVVVNGDRIITGQTVEGSKEAAAVERLVEQSERVSGQKVEELLPDGGFFCAVVAVLCMMQDISLLCPQGRSQGGEAGRSSRTGRSRRTSFGMMKRRTNMSVRRASG
jgi:transposase